MTSGSVALALLGGVIGAGFASGRELVRFFAGHGAMTGAAVLCAVGTLGALFLRLPAQMERAGCGTLGALCVIRFGVRLGRLCTGLFAVLCAVTGGAMLAACAELAALTLPIRPAYALGLLLTLALGTALSWLGVSALALPGLCLCALLPVLLVRLLALPVGEACFLAELDPPAHACADGAVYGALNAAMLAGAMPLLLPLSRAGRRRSVALFALLFGALLTLGALVCRRHLSAVLHQPLPFVWLSRSLGGGYLLVAACLYAAALSTLCAMLKSLSLLLPLSRGAGTAVSALACLAAALPGFGALVHSAYPVLGALCAGLMLLLCTPPGAGQSPRPSAR